MTTLFTSPWSHCLPRTKAELIASVASDLGVQSDSELEAKALEFLDDTIDYLNTHLWEFNRVEETGLALTASSPTVALAHLFYREHLAHMVAVDGGRAEPPLTFMPFVDFNRQYGVPTDEGLARVYTYNNLHHTGQLLLNLVPTTDNAADYTLTINYYTRVPRLSTIDSAAKLSIPAEVEQILKCGAKKLLAAHVDNPSKTTTWAALEAQAIDAMRGIDRRSPGGGLRFRVVDFVRR